MKKNSDEKLKGILLKAELKEVNIPEKEEKESQETIKDKEDIMTKEDTIRIEETIR